MFMSSAYEYLSNRDVVTSGSNVVLGNMVVMSVTLNEEEFVLQPSVLTGGHLAMLVLVVTVAVPIHSMTTKLVKYPAKQP